MAHAHTHERQALPTVPALLTLLFLMLFLFPAGPARAEPLDLEALAWRLGADPSTLPPTLSECPETLQVARADRTVLQTLEGRVYHWREYDLVSGTCVVLLDPVVEALAPERAAWLLAASHAASGGPGGTVERRGFASGTVRAASAGRGTVEAPALLERSLAALTSAALRVDRQSAHALPRRHAAPGLQPRAQAPSVDSKLVFGADARQRVLDTTQFPWSTVCYVESVFPDGSVFGLSGVLAGPYTVLTSALALYLPEHGGWVESVEVVPGQTQEFEGGDIYAPWGSQFGALVEVPLAWFEEGDPAALYGAIFLDQPFAGLENTMPIVFDALPAGQVNMAGYDQKAQGELDSYAQWTRTGTLVGLDAVYFDHRMDDDEGAIGAPAWEFFEATSTRRVFGLNCCELADGTANAGVRFTSANRDLISEWILYQPDDGGDDGDGGDDDDVVPIPLFIGGGGERFRVEAVWRDHQGNRGSGQPIVLTEDTGYFWFFSDDNVEVVLKVLDACVISGHYWVFAAGLTDVEVSLEIEDTLTGQRWSAFNPRSRPFAPIQDTAALAVCP